MKKIFYLTCICIFPGMLCAQVSIMAEESQYYRSLGHSGEWYEIYHQQDFTPVHYSRSGCTPDKMVFGWHPYWSNGLQGNYNWDLLTDLSYFSYEVNASTGQALSTNSWATAPVIDTALARGVRVNLCVTLFANHATFFGSSAAQTTLINNLLNLVQARGAHGVNIDFEGLPSGQAAAFTSFMINLCNTFHNANPNYQVSLCLYAVDWNNVFNEQVLAQYVDYFTIMGYDYYWTGSSQAGPVDPLYGFSASYDRSLSRTVTYYLSEGIPAHQLILGLPYYGREWETVSNSVPSNTTGNNVSARTYAYVRNNSNGFYNNPQFNLRSNSTVYIFQNGGTWRQCWIGNAGTYKDRYEMVRRRGLAGIAIWALGYDNGYTDLWDAIGASLTDCYADACTDTVYDMGGPLVDYYDRENYIYTISPPGATQIQAQFVSFTTEANYDTLFLYDGNSIASPLIGAYHGSNSPGSFATSGGHLTLHFKSDGATRAAGWEMRYQCITDQVPPQTAMTFPNGWITQDFVIGNTDTDVGSGVKSAFRHTAFYNGTEWRSNTARGVFTDAFDDMQIHPEWTGISGIWNENNSLLSQTDENNGNTNIYAYMAQDQHDAYLYHFRAMIEGTGNNRRAGFHFYADSASLPNRGNGYFVWFRVDQSQLQFYKVINDVFYLQHTEPLVVNAGQWYDYVVIHEPAAGHIFVFRDTIFVGRWTDPMPLTSGKYVSFRSGNARFHVDYFEAYHSRDTNTADTIVVGNCGGCDFLFQNSSPFIPAGRIKNAVVDYAHNIHYGDSREFDVDWTAPNPPAVLYETGIPDADTACTGNTHLFAWEQASDIHSGVTLYQYSLGSQPGIHDIVPLTSANLDTFMYHNPGSYTGWIFLNVVTENAAGLSSVATGDGVFFMECQVGLPEVDNTVRIYPVPARENIWLESDTPLGLVVLLDAQGKEIFSVYTVEKNTMISLEHIPAGIYFAGIHGKYRKIIKK